MHPTRAVAGWSHTFGYYARLYWEYLRLYGKTLVEYRADTWLALGAGLFAQGAALVFLSALFGRIPDLDGWSFWEVGFILGFSTMGRALNQVFFDAPFSIHGMIASGELDILLVRPVGPLLQTIGLRQNLNGLGVALTGALIMFSAASHLHLAWTPGRLAYLVPAVATCQAIQFAVLLSVATTAFWLIRVRSLMYPVVWLYDLTRYPLDIFSGWLKGLLLSALPYAFASFFPAAYLLRPEEYALYGWLSPVVGAAALAAALAFWRHGLNRYASAGA